MTIIIPANTLADAAFSVDNSCRFNDGDSAYMHKTPDSTTNIKKWTLSLWVKLGDMASRECLLWASSDGGSSDYVEIQFKADRTLNWQVKGSSGTTPSVLETTRLFRDPSAWYHLVFVWDSDNGTAGNRQRIYVNGTEETVFNTDTNPSSGDGSVILTSGVEMDLGKQHGTTHYFDGYMAEVALCDGQTYAASDFGEFDEDSPTIWKPKDISGLTFGTHGFYLDFEASDNLGNDANGGTDLTEVNFAAADQATDTPTNNFCTLNPLDNYYDPATFSEGNLSITTETDGRSFKTGTFGISKGKWYWEIFRRNANGHTELGIAGMPSDAADDHLGKDAFTYAVHSDDGQWFTNDSGSSFVSAHNSGGTYPNHVVSIALDLDNNKFYFGINGTWENSGDPTSGATGTGAKAIAAASTTPTGLWFPAVSDKHNAYNIQLDMNFGGTSAFGATAVASANQDGNGYGNFEFAVPSGYYALCTKNLAEYG